MLFLLLFASLAQDLPDGPGKETLLKLCRDCHDLDTVTVENRTREGWKKTMAKMVERGADGTDEEFELIVNYLTKNFGRINVNKAPAAEIASYLGFSNKEAEAIVQYREKNGAFKDWREVKKVEGLDPAKVEAKKDRIGVN
jgi:competence protein ComEA